MEALTASLPSDKSELRRHFRALRAGFIAREGRQAERKLAHNLQRLLQDLAVAQVAIYHAQDDEARFQLPDQSTCFYPRIEGQDLKFYRPHNGTETFRAGALGILEPDPAQAQPLNPAQDSVICCPGVAFDCQGTRLGMGKGFYDRYFAADPHACRVGVGYQIQVSKDPLPADSWDQRVDWIVTEEMILRTSDRSP